jgi:hypothetical protein
MIPSRLTLGCILGCLLLLDSTRVAAGSPLFASSQMLPAVAAFGLATGGGFGAKSSSKEKGGSKKKPKKATKKMSPPATNLHTPEGRMAHIGSRIRDADLSSMASLTLTTSTDGDANLALDVDPNAICVVDEFLGPDFIASLRSEAESLLPTMVPSQSTRWDGTKVVPYEKHQVMSMQIEGGTEGYAASPRLVEYVVTLTTQLSSQLNRILPDIYKLSGEEQTNKLAVCLGDGSKYDKHIDNGGESDRRKLTALLYLQPPEWFADAETKYPDESEEGDARGGYFRAYDVPAKDSVTSIAPKGDRLLLFWSDSLVHDVSPSFAPNGDLDRRWALTVWFVVNDAGVIRATDAEIQDRHFGTG